MGNCQHDQLNVKCDRIFFFSPFDCGDHNTTIVQQLVVGGLKVAIWQTKTNSETIFCTAVLNLHYNTSA